MADWVIGAPSLYSRKQPITTSIANRAEGGAIKGVAYESVHDRLLAMDGTRLLMFDVRPDHMQHGPEALAVFGQSTFLDRTTRGVGPKKMTGTAVADGGTGGRYGSRRTKPAPVCH